jgi:hypothetical protein
VRIRASCLSDKPGGTGATGRERGSIGAGVEDRLCGSGAASGSVCSDSNCCRSVQESDPSWARGMGLKGVIVVDAPPSMKAAENEDRADLRLRSLRRRRKKTTVPIATSTAATPQMAPPTIAAFDEPADAFFSIGSAFIWRTGALQVGSS